MDCIVLGCTLSTGHLPPSPSPSEPPFFQESEARGELRRGRQERQRACDAQKAVKTVIGSFW